MRRPVIAGNWKMFKTRLETSAFFDDLIPQIQNVEHCDIVVAPPYTALATAAVEAEVAKGRDTEPLRDAMAERAAQGRGARRLASDEARDLGIFPVTFG